MMDNFKEDIACKRNRLLPDMLYAACWVLIVAFGLYAFLLLQVLLVQFQFATLVMLLACAALAVYLYLFKDNLKLEYEYTFTNGTLDFAKVLRNVKRKELGSMNVANVSACGHVAHDSFRRFISQKDVEKKNWFVNRDGNLFYFYYVKEGKKTIIVMEPSEEMVEMIRHYVPAGVYQG